MVTARALAAISDARLPTGRFGKQPSSESGMVSAPMVDGQSRFALACHADAFLASLPGLLGPGSPEGRQRLGAAVDCLAAVTVADPQQREALRLALSQAVRGPGWRAVDECRRLVGAACQADGDVDADGLSGSVEWVIERALNRPDSYRQAVADHLWRFTHPQCPAGKRARYAERAAAALSEAGDEQQVLRLVKLWCDGFASPKRR